METTRMQEIKRGQRIYAPGDSSQHMFLVKTGVIKVAAVGPDDRDLLLCDPGAVALGVGSATGEGCPRTDVPLPEDGPRLRTPIAE